MLFILFSVFVYATEFYSKSEPFSVYKLQSNVSGLVIKADENLEGKVLSTSEFIVVDDYLDKKELVNLKDKKVSYEKSLKLNIKMSKIFKIMIEKKNLNYEKIKNLPIKSSIEKDKEFFDLSSTQTQELSSLEKIQTIKTQLSDTNFRIEQLEKSIKDKHIKAPEMVLYKLFVKKGQFVSMGATLAELADISRSKLTIYLNSDEIVDAKEKSIYLNGNKTKYKINKIWPLSDSEHISSYKTEIIIDAPSRFSKLYKIEFK